MNFKRSTVLLIALLCSVMAANAQTSKPVAAAVEPSVTIDVAGKKTKLGTAELAKLKRLTINAKDHGKDASFEGVAMADVLMAVGVELGEKLRGKRMAEFLVVEAADNYKAVFALAEFDASFTDNVIILADKRDGKALAENAGNFQIVVPGEKRAARWVRQVLSMKVVTAN